MRTNELIAAAVVFGMVYYAARLKTQSAGMTNMMDIAASDVYAVTGVDLQNWQIVAARPENADYVTAMHTAEAKYGMPDNLLVRLAYQESRFRPDIISGKTISGAGAVGIMQIVPRWHPNVNPLDPVASIDYAGQFLADLYNRFGTWELALQAYNWGQGNLSNFLKGRIASMPAETTNYSKQILADLSAAGITVA